MKSINIIVCLVLLCSLRATAQTLSEVSNTCAGNWVSLYVGGGGSNCTGVVVPNSSWWHFYPEPDEKQFNGGYNSVNVKWNNPTADIQVYVGYQCMQQATTGTTNSVHFSVLPSVAAPTPTLQITDTRICENSIMHFKATCPNPGPSPSYWYYFDNQTMPFYDISFSTTTTAPPPITYDITGKLSPGWHTAYVRVSNSLGCASPSYANSPAVSFYVTPIKIVDANWVDDGEICPATHPNLNAHISVQTPVADLVYRWRYNGSYGNSTTDPNHIYVNPTDNTDIGVEVSSTSENWCINLPKVFPPNLAYVNVAQSTAPTLDIVIPANKYTYCPGESITVKSSQVGTSYTWKIGTTTLAQNTQTITIPVTDNASLTTAYSSGEVISLHVGGINSNGGCLSTDQADATSTPLNLVVNPLPNVATNPSGTSRVCTGCTKTMALVTAGPAGTTYQWYRNNVAITNPETGWNTSSFSTNALNTYKVKVTKLCENTSAVITLIANTPPVVNAGGNQSISLPTTTLVLNGSVNDPDTDGTITGAVWTKLVGPTATMAPANANLNTRTATSKLTLTNLVIGYYLFRLTATDNTGEVVSNDVEVIVYPKNNYNYVRTETLLTPTTAAAGVMALPIGSRNETTEYFDGLGRPLQSVVTQGSANNKKDIVSPSAYDQFGREAFKYLPYVSTDNSGDYKTDAVGATPATYLTSPQYMFYNTPGADKVVDDPRPFSTTKFEPSPLSRADKEYGPGKAWAPVNSGGNNKFVKHSYLSNIHGTANNTTDEKIIAWKVYRTGKIVRQPVNAGFIETGGYYSTNQLTVDVTLDEAGNAMREYTNRDGQLVLRKVQLKGGATAPLNDVLQWTQTYYVYDDFGDLRYVFQPELSKLMYASDTFIPTETQIRQFAFRYVYDSRHRMTEKWVPGADVVYMVYDPRDRLVMTQDGAQRAKSPAREWTVIKYDILNRPIITGLLPDSYGWSLSFVQTYVTNFYNNLAAGKAWYEDRGSDMHGYTNKSYPDQLLPTECITVTYYDDYGFKNAVRKPSDYAYSATDISGLPSKEQTVVEGQVTGSKVRVLDGEAFGELQWLTSYTYYDDQYRVIQMVSDNYKGGKDRTSALFDFSKLLKTKTTHEARVVKWSNLVNVGMEGNKIVKKTGATDTWDASAMSAEVLAANTNGSIETSASEEWTYRLVGLAAQNPNGNPALVNYGLILQAGGNLVKAELGTYTTVGTYCSGDTLRIERAGNQITYKKNGVALASPTVGLTSALNAVSVFYSMNGSIAYCKASFASKITPITGEFEYDHMNRATNQWNQVAANPKVVVSRTNYNDLGQLVEKRLHGTNATASDAKETIDYLYNIRGWLKSINDPQTTSKLFAITLNYETPSANGGTSQYNGNISEMVWRNAGSARQSYGYYYDSLNRLKDARYFNLDATALNGRFTETVGGVGSKGYDLNGNIRKLTRMGRASTTAFGTMDVLTYTYTGNQLTRVDDTQPLNAAEQGFKELVKAANEYVYDANGAMTKDDNKGIQTIGYNYLNLPRKVSKSATDYVTYVYDATGRKLFQQMFSSTGNRRTDYAGMFTYQNDTLKFATHQEGRVMLTAATPEYQYTLKDHLGNVRLTFSAQQTTESVTGTLETANAAVDQANFLRYTNARRVQSSLFDHTNGAATGYAQRLNGSANEKYGLARSLSVMPGDVVNMEVYAKYIDVSSANRTAALNTLLTQIAAGTAPAGTVVDGGGYASSTSSFPFPGLLNTSGSTGGPKAYLNYLVFDRDYNFKTGGFVRISTTPKETGGDVAHERMHLDNITINEAGYVYIYLSNEESTPVEVFFDDFKVTQSKSGIMQQDDYYPFGLTFNSYQRENSVKQDYKYNGKELQDELNVGWLDYGARMYSSEIGKWLAIDPLDYRYESISPYVYTLNNPVRYVDLFGMEATEPQKGDGEVFRETYKVGNVTHVDIYYDDSQGGQGNEGGGGSLGFGSGEIGVRQQQGGSRTERILWSGVEKAVTKVKDDIAALPGKAIKESDDMVHGYGKYDRKGQPPLVLKVVAGVFPNVAITNGIKIWTYGINIYNESKTTAGDKAAATIEVLGSVVPFFAAGKNVGVLGKVFKLDDALEAGFSVYGGANEVADKQDKK